MRIALILDDFPVISETFILNQITGLIDRGHDIDIFAKHSPPNPQVHPDVTRYNLLNKVSYRARQSHRSVVRVAERGARLAVQACARPGAAVRSLRLLPFGGLGASLAGLSLSSSLRARLPYDIVHAHYGPNGLLGVHLKTKEGVCGKLITTFYGYDYSQYVKQHGQGVYRQLFEGSDLILSISDCMKQQLIGIGCREDKLEIHHLGVDCGKFICHPHNPRDTEKTRILTIGRLVEKKGIEYGLRAIAKVAKVRRDIEYQIVGDGELRPKLETLIDQLGIQDIAILYGSRRQDEVVDILSNADIVLTPSVTSRAGDQEGTPTVLLEALAAGKPVVSTIHAAIPELVQNGVSGFLSPERNVDSLAKNVLHLVEHPETWARMGQAGRAYVEREHDIEKLNDRLVQIYERVMAS